MTSTGLKPISAAALTLLLTACSTHVTLQNPTIPDPLIAQLPLSVAVRYPEQFQHYVHEEKVIGKDEWTIDLGRSNSLLFTKLFGAMFEDCTVIAPAPAIDEGDEELAKLAAACKFVPPGTNPETLQIDALIEPSIDAFEFSVPNQSQTDSFAVWIRYRLKIFDAGGNQIANWPLSAYGKAMNSLMGGDEALQHAAVLAMRDAAALVILQMDKSTGISALVAARRGHPTEPEADVSREQGNVVETIPMDQALRTTAKEDLQDDSG